MVGGDRRSPPRHRAKGGGGKGKDGGGNEELGAGANGIVKDSGIKLTAKNGEKFQSVGYYVEDDLQQVTGKNVDLQGNIKPDGSNCAISMHDTSMDGSIAAVEVSGMQIGESPIISTSNSCDKISWAQEVEECEASGSDMVNSVGVTSSVCTMEHSNLSNMEELQQHPRSSLTVHAMHNQEEKSDLLQAAAINANVQNLSSCTTGMICDGVSPAHDDNSNGAVFGSVNYVNWNEGSWKIKKSVENGGADSNVLHRNYSCSQGVRSLASKGQCAVNTYVKTGLIGSRNSANNSSFLPPMNMHSAENAYVNDGIMDKGKSASYSSSLPPVKRTPQNSNAWKKPEHLRVDEDDLKHISDDGRSLAFDVDAYETNKVKLDKGLIGKIIGRKLPLHILDQELSRRWSFVGGFRTILLSGDYFLCIFESMEARDKILLGGPWQILGHIIGLDKWSHNFNSDGLNGLSSPVWVRLPKLPLLFWDKKTISRIGAMIGKPLWIDAQTTTWGRCEYARLCVRMELSKRLPTGVWIQEHSSKFFQPIEYEGITLLCFHCGIVGHKAESCPNAHTFGTNLASGAVHSMAGEMENDGTSNTLKTTKPSSGGLSKVADTSHTKEPSMAKTSGLTTQLDTLEGEKDYGPWILVTRKRKPPRNSGKFRHPNFRTPPAPPVSVVPSPLEACDKEGMVVDSAVEGFVFKAQDICDDIITPQQKVGSPPHLGSTTINNKLKSSTSRQPRNRSGKDRVSKAHFEKELLQLGPIALKSRKRKKKATTGGADLCLDDFNHASDSGGGDASPSRGK